MGSPGHLLILLLFLLILIQEHKRLLVFGHIGKLGRCPIVTIHCDHRERDECYRDINCKGPEKCCMYSCGMKCLDPKEDPCIHYAKRVPCSHYVRRWYYSKRENNCLRFQYSPCSKSKNSFQSYDVCNKTCLVFGHRILSRKSG